MDHESFDRIARVLGTVGSRRAALGALLGTGVAGTLGAVEAAKKDRKKNRKSGKRGRGKTQVSAQAADCSSPGQGTNISDCDYTGAAFSGEDLSSSRMVGTIFRGATLVGTDLSSSNAKGADFRGANLACADLSSSQLRNADFRGADLTGADLHSSACGGIRFNSNTTFCGTIDCNGKVRNDACPGGPDSAFCCLPCGAGEACVNNECVAVCDEPTTPTSCDCVTTFGSGDPVCAVTVGLLNNPSCTSDDGCTGEDICAGLPCISDGRCAAPCPLLDECTCVSGPASCAASDRVRCGESAAAARRASGSAARKLGAP